VLQHLVRVDDVEGVVGIVEVVHVGGPERDVGQVALLDFGAGRAEDVGDLIDGRDRSGCDPGGEVSGDRPGSATNVEHGQARPQMGQQVSRGILGGPSSVTAEHRLVMAVGIGGLPFVAHDLQLTRTSIIWTVCLAI
jgi:hypothetical protein